MTNDNNRNDFLEFLSSNEAPPQGLCDRTQKDIKLTFRGHSIVIRFLSFQLIGALITLTFCPQFGLGFSEGHGIAHVFRMLGDSACAIFCGSLFLLAGNVTAFLFMDADEVFWIWKHYRYRLVLIPPFLWGTLMLFNLGLSLDGESTHYHVTWIFSAIFIQELLFWMKAKFYRGILKKA